MGSSAFGSVGASAGLALAGREGRGDVGDEIGEGRGSEGSDVGSRRVGGGAGGRHGRDKHASKTQAELVIEVVGSVSRE